MADRRWHASDFDYALPHELIAQHPAERRGASRLLVVERAGRTLADARFTALAEHIPPGDVLVINTTRVRHARLIGTRPGGGRAEVLLIHPAPDGSWIAMGSPGRALRPGRRIALGPGAEIETVAVDTDGMRRVRFVGIAADEAIRRFGRLPLPPYIARAPEPADEQRYQTVYAEREGSVAAPTAGLHFTDELLQTLRTRGVVVDALDLEVGPGTFRPVEGDVARHAMHHEHYTIPEQLAAAVAAARARGAARLGGGNDGGPRPRERGATRPHRHPGRARHRPAHRARVSFPGGGPSRHQLPLAPVHLADAGFGFRRPRTHDGRVPPCGGGTLPLLQLRRRHVRHLRSLV